MRVGRRQVLLSGFGLGLAAAAGPRLAAAGRRQASATTCQHLRYRARRRHRSDGELAAGGRRGGAVRPAVLSPARQLRHLQARAEIRHANSRRAGQIGASLHWRRQAHQHRRRRRYPPDRTDACRRGYGDRRRRPSRRRAGQGPRHLGLPLSRQRRERRGAAQSLGRGQGLRDRRHSQSRPAQRGCGRARDRPQPCARLRRQRHLGVALGRRRRRQHRRLEPGRADRRQERRRRPERQRHRLSIAPARCW